MNKPTVAVVILNWNGKHWLEKFLPGVLQSNYPDLKIVVGDNASTDESISFLKANFSAVEIISNEKNLGFAGGYNEVLKHVTADYYILLNSDVEVPKDWIAPVIELMECDEKIAAAQPKFILQTDKTYLEYSGAAGGMMDKFGYMFCQGRIFNTLEKDENQFNTSREIFWACGACLFIKSKMFWEVGGFDADFFAHQEEVDLCWRLKTAGYRIYYCAESHVYHAGGGMLPPSNPFKTFLNFRNSLYLLYKNLPEKNRERQLFYRMILDGIAAFKFLTEGKWKETLAVYKAHQQFFKEKKGLKAKRNNNPLATPLTAMAGYYKGSIIWEYFVKGKKKIGELNPLNFCD